MDDGWDDDDIDVNSDGDEEIDFQGGNKGNDDVNVQDGWDDPDLDLDDDDLLEVESPIGDIQKSFPMPPPPPPPQPTSQMSSSSNRQHLSDKERNILVSLRDYVTTLPHLGSSINAVLEAEYNTYDHALSLCEYYDNRPQLKAYTIETELPRMTYSVDLHNGTVLTEKSEVAMYMAQKDSIIIRSANQSLLADLLTVLTGPDLVIRPQHLATGIATHCSFSIDSSHVLANVRLDISIPGASGQRLNIAYLEMSVLLEPDLPSVQYQLKQIVTLLENNNNESAALHQAAIFLATMDVEDLYDHESATGLAFSPQKTTHAFRDAFLVQLSKTQQIVQGTSTGLSSAWKQIDTVANVSSKIDFMKKVGGGILPSLPKEVLLEDDEYDQQQQYHVPSMPIRSAPSERPPPLLGGFLRAGLNRLAQSVSIPNEEPLPEEEVVVFPRLYRPTPPPPPSSRTPQQNPLIHSSAPPPPPPPSLRVLQQNLPMHTSQEETTAFPKLYRPTPPPPPRPSIIEPEEEEITFPHISQSIPPPPPPPLSKMQQSDNHDDLDTTRLVPQPSYDEVDENNGGGAWDDDDEDLEFDDEIVFGDSSNLPASSNKAPYSPTVSENNQVSTMRKPPPPPPPPPAILHPNHSSAQPPSPPYPVATTVKKYNPENDIIPTRVRWINRRFLQT